MSNFLNKLLKNSFPKLKISPKHPCMDINNFASNNLIFNHLIHPFYHSVHIQLIIGIISFNWHINPTPILAPTLHKRKCIRKNNFEKLMINLKAYRTFENIGYKFIDIDLEYWFGEAVENAIDETWLYDRLAFALCARGWMVLAVLQE